MLKCMSRVLLVDVYLSVDLPLIFARLMNFLNINTKFSSTCVPVILCSHLCYLYCTCLLKFGT